MHLLRSIFWGLAFGLIAGIAGVFIWHFSEPSYSWFSLDTLTVLSVPGQFITWIQHGNYDWVTDEEWSFKYWIITWNTLFWALLFMTFSLIALPIRFLVRLDRSCKKTEQGAAANP